MGAVATTQSVELINGTSSVTTPTLTGDWGDVGARLTQLDDGMDPAFATGKGEAQSDTLERGRRFKIIACY